MSRGFFITGTDTGVGKTRFTLALMQELKNQGLTVAGMKPVATGAKKKNNVLINEDAEQISKLCSNTFPYELINPVVYELPVAPHIAADLANLPIDKEKIKTAYDQLAENSDIVIVEGVGGWRVPLSINLSLVNLVKELDLDVIMVVGIKLGCINHALLTAEAILSDGLALVGWASNQLDNDCLCQMEIIASLKERLACTHIVNIDYMNHSHLNWTSKTVINAKISSAHVQ